MSAGVGGPGAARWTGMARQWAAVAWVMTMVVLLAAGVFLGLSYSGHALVPGANVLLAPAGALLAIPSALQLTGRFRAPWHAAGARRAPALTALTGLALFGGGMLAVSQAEVWRALCLPALLCLIAYLLGTLRHRPSRSPFCLRARRRGGRLWMWQAYAGLWIMLLVSPVGVAWSIGLIQIR